MTDNILVGPDDFTTFSVWVQNDLRLPGGGNYVIGKIADVNPNRVGQTQSITTVSSNCGDQVEHWDGFDLSAQAGLAGGIYLQGGISTGKTTIDDCEIVEKLPETIGTTGTAFCQHGNPWLTQVKFGGSYTLPFDIQVSGRPVACGLGRWLPAPLAECLRELRACR